MVITEHGIEGSLVYAASALLRDEIARTGQAQLTLNLRPDFVAEHVQAEVRHPRGSRSLSSHLKSRLNLQAVHLALLHEVLTKDALNDPVQLAHAIEHLPITAIATRPLDEAISSAGGVKLEALDGALMALHAPGVFVAGEMLDWEAPTGGYLLSACLASGRHAAKGALAYLHLNARTSTSL
jgi:predicted flavoprotein YhiN